MAVNVSEEKLYIATVGSKMRISIPPNAADHIGIKPGDYVTLIPDEFDEIRFLCVYPVKKENFKLSQQKKADIVNSNNKL